jgi:hypothetical protein
MKLPYFETCTYNLELYMQKLLQMKATAATVAAAIAATVAATTAATKLAITAATVAAITTVTTPFI